MLWGNWEGGGLAWGVKPNPWIVAAYWKCILLLNSPSRSGLHCNCTFTPCRHATKRREVRCAPCSSTPHLPACPQTQIVLLCRKDQNIQINNLQPSKGCTHMLGFKALTLGRGSRHFGEMFYSRLLHPALRPTKSGQQYWRYLIAPCEVLPGAPHLQPVHPFPLSEEKTYRMRSLSIINILETRSRESNYFLTSTPKGNLS